ncbi:MAG TPA: quinone-interacting membrane-bound oxidoreductase complex subunit QmoC [Syntrophorhabdales bacterium]|nr:quinone-interacting membrane-bound oxidoreductase complex subunit QmoC [Syntrophorhabdales bacterium]
MPQATVTEPDLKFVKEIKGCGGDALKKCFQCASCSTVCNLSPDDHPFPRKEMVWAQWGLKSKLSRDPDLWLCHQCNDCTEYCPRGAKPGDVLAALRRLVIRENAFPRFLARMVNDPRFLPVVFAIPVILLLLLMANAGTLRIPHGEIIYRNFIPQWPVVDVLFPLTAIWTVICSAVVIRRFWSGLREGSDGRLLTQSYSWGQVVPLLSNILRHKYFQECKASRSRYLAHFNIMWGFILLAVTTTCVAAGVYLFHYETPYSLSNPIKWIGNVGALILILGSSLAFVNRLSKPDAVGKGTYFDWLFLLVVLATGVTGLLAEILRLANAPDVAYPVYFIHLVFVWFLFAYLPFSKFAHLLYRTTALMYASRIGRELKKGTALSSIAAIQAGARREIS